MSATRFIVVRHCEAQGNIRRVFNGITDGDITENGARQLDLLAAPFAICCAGHTVGPLSG